MLSRIEQHLRQHWVHLGMDSVLPPDRFRWLVINGGINIRSKLVCPLWLDNSRLPALIVKFARYPQYSERLSVEYSALEHLQGYLPAGRELAPRPVAIFEVSGLLVTVETAVPGRPLRAALREDPHNFNLKLRRLAPLARWTAQVHRRSAHQATAADLRALLFEPLEAASKDLQPDVAEERALVRLRDAAYDLAGRTRLPAVFNHNDPGTTNVMTDRAGRFTGLIDWESGEFGLPAIDPIYSLARFAYETRAAGGPDQLRGYRELFFHGEDRDRGSLEPGISAEWLREYCAATGLHKGWLPVLFGLGWIMHARNERNRMLELRREGQVLHGKPAAVEVAATDEDAIFRGHFRSQLRYYLHNMDSSVVNTLAEVDS